ncbi:MAG: hypothetical protein Q7V05_04520 [Methanoregula sp.]|nr:hypothetical protein [Methanoregula sp.]
MDEIKFSSVQEGDYTKERKQWLSNDLYEICKEIQQMQKQE